MLSVCLATYNGEKFIKEQILSILRQLGNTDEVIISDDHSTDKTIEVINSLNDSRIKIFYNPVKMGYSGNFENAIMHAAGDIIFLSDQDDVWIDGKVDKMAVMLDKYDLVVSDAQFVDKDLNLINETFYSLRGGKLGFFCSLYKSRHLGACMAFRRGIFPKLLPFPKRGLLCPHDTWISLISEFYFKVGIITEPLIYYRRHGNNVSNGGYKSENSLYKKFLFRSYSLMMVLSRLVK